VGKERNGEVPVEGTSTRRHGRRRPGLVEALSSRLSDHVAVQQAVGVLMQRHDLSESQARTFLYEDAAVLNLRPAEFAHLVVDSTRLLARR
jgi:AmiR/NasT family two-component response regulator